MGREGVYSSFLVGYWQKLDTSNVDTVKVFQKYFDIALKQHIKSNKYIWQKTAKNQDSTKCSTAYHIQLEKKI